MVDYIKMEDLKNLKDINLIDIRSKDLYDLNHIPNAINIPTSQLLANTNKYLDKTNKYYIYCQKGFQSKKICQILSNLGYNVTNILGGFDSWLLLK